MKKIILSAAMLLFCWNAFSQTTPKPSPGLTTAPSQRLSDSQRLQPGGFQKPGLPLGHTETEPVQSPLLVPAQALVHTMPVAKPKPDRQYAALALAPDSNMLFHLRVKKS
ncbi:hypothetical protein GU926_01790 [Nibribacter ruber]|uniref:Uncharacterized protein n=1 Tax=Nibribacter ruber TaxID=2698458 RepID=A0A6P1NZ96_9BACT|nr:hypothetical protein [Nibribacter ruber]QHL86243.1 hypothetical protein GU926_01790 [Nibribacter ruber]